MASSMKWHGKAFQKYIHEATGEGLDRAGTFYHARCQEAVSKPNTGVRVPVVRQTPGGNKTSRTVYPNPSKPGEAPRLRTGFGRTQIVKEYNPKEPYVRVGVTANGMYMFFLEIGTQHIERRPWLVATLMNNLQVIGKLAASGK